LAFAAVGFVKQLARGIVFGVNAGDLFQLERPFESDRIQRAAVEGEAPSIAVCA
jgi:hypothetical protein